MSLQLALSDYSTSDLTSALATLRGSILVPKTRPEVADYDVVVRKDGWSLGFDFTNRLVILGYNTFKGLNDAGNKAGSSFVTFDGGADLAKRIAVANSTGMGDINGGTIGKAKNVQAGMDKWIVEIQKRLAVLNPGSAKPSIPNSIKSLALAAIAVGGVLAIVVAVRRR